MDVSELILAGETKFRSIIGVRIRDKNDADECYAAITFECLTFVVANFDASFGVPFDNYLMQTYRLYVLKWLTKESRHESRFVAFTDLQSNEIKEDSLLIDAEDMHETSALDDVEYVSMLMARARLTEWDRAILKARYFDNMAIADIGDMYNYAEPTVRVSLSRAVQKLRDVAYNDNSADLS